MKTALAKLIRMLPEEFRERFGAEMIDQIRADYDRELVQSRVIATGLLASYVPARRASSVDLIESLRSD